MIPDGRIRELWIRFLEEGRLSPEEERELSRALEADPVLRRECLGDLEVDGFLQAIGTSRDEDEGFQSSFFERLKAEGDASRFIRKVESRIAGGEGPLLPPAARAGAGPVRAPISEGTGSKARHRLPGHSSPSGSRSFSPSWTPFLIAAGIFVTILGLVALLSSGDLPDRTGPHSTRTASGMKGFVGQRVEPAGPNHGEDAPPRPPAPEPSPRKETPPPVGPQPGEALARPPEALLPAPAPRGEKPQVGGDLREKGPRSQELPLEAAPKKEPQPLQVPAPLPKEGKTQTAVARLEEVSGEAFLLAGQERLPAKAGADLLEKQGLECLGGESRIALRFPDNTRLEIGPGTLVLELKSSPGKGIVLQRGLLRAQVTKQPPDRPMICSTPHGEVKVVGTRFRLLVNPDPKVGTRLEVTEGQVELRNGAGRSALVGAGQYSVAGEGTDPVVRALPIDEILLGPRQARLVGGEWSLAKDRGVPSGTVLFARETSYRPRKVGAMWIYDSVKSRPSYVLFSFVAEGGKDYQVWIRGKSLAEDAAHLTTAEVAVELPDAQLTPPDAQPALAADRAYGFNGFFRFQGYGWIGGSGEHPEQGRPDEVPLTVRFARSGLQTLKLHALQSPAWIDAIWISATQRTRPEASLTGPAGK